MRSSALIHPSLSKSAVINRPPSEHVNISSRSQQVPMPTWSKTSCEGLYTSGQLSVSFRTPSPSPSSVKKYTVPWLLQFDPQPGLLVYGAPTSNRPSITARHTPKRSLGAESFASIISFSIQSPCESRLYTYTAPVSIPPAPSRLNAPMNARSSPSSATHLPNRSLGIRSEASISASKVHLPASRRKT